MGPNRHLFTGSQTTAEHPTTYPAPRTSGLPYPLRNTLGRWHGLLGMIVGVGIALGLGMTMLAVSKASMDLFTADYKLSGADLYVVTEGGTLIALLPGDTPGTIKHARHVLSQVRGIGDVNEALGIMTWSLEREQQGRKNSDAPDELIMTVGVDGDPTRIPNVLLLNQGRWLRRSNEIVLGARLSREKALYVGDSLRLNGRDFTVVGIGRLRGIGFTSAAAAYVDYRSLRQRAAFGDVVNFLILDAQQPEAVAPRVEASASVSVFTPGDLVEQAEEANAAGVVTRWIFNLLTLGIAGIFVSSMLGRFVAERRVEFATLRAIGVPRATIFMTVGTQALFVSLGAAVFGVCLSLLLGWLINSTLAPEYGFESLYAVDASLFAIIVALALALGLLSGLVPARQATRVDPVEILREV